MRLWSIHPKYLDAKGLVALWRETLLAKHVLEDKTKGYRNHPQLNRFRDHEEPLQAINYYLSIVFEEACERGYRFDKEKINCDFSPAQIMVTQGQVNYEVQHLKRKLKQRDPDRLGFISNLENFDTHPLFKKTKGRGVEKWEVVSKLPSAAK